MTTCQFPDCECSYLCPAVRHRIPPAALPQREPEDVARKIAAWIGYSFEGLSDRSVADRQVREWWRGAYQGGKPDLLRLADALMAHPRPEPQAASAPIPEYWIKCPSCGFVGRDILYVTRPEHKPHCIHGLADYDICPDCAPFPRPDGGRLTFCERCNANRVHVRTKIIDGVQMFECPVCAVARPESETPPAFSEENLAHCLSYHTNETVRDWDICRAVDAYRAPRNKGDTRTLADFLEAAGLRISAVASQLPRPERNGPVTAPSAPDASTPAQEPRE